MNTNLWQYLTVTLQFRDKLCGGIPKSPEAIDGWIRAVVENKNRLEQIIADTKIEMKTDALTDEQIEELKQACWIGFKSNGAGLYIEGRQVKAMLKEAANVIKNRLDMTAFKARVAERLFIRNDTIPLGVDAPSGSHESMIHAMTASGPINALKRVDYVTQPTITFHLKALNEPFVNKKKEKLPVLDALRLLLEYGSENGLGADRSQGYGQFDVLEITPEEKSA